MNVICTQEINNAPGTAVVEIELNAQDLQNLAEGKALVFTGVTLGNTGGSIIKGSGDLTTYAE